MKGTADVHHNAPIHLYLRTSKCRKQRMGATPDLEIARFEVAPHGGVEGAENEAKHLSAAEHGVEADRLVGFREPKEKAKK